MRAVGVDLMQRGKGDEAELRRQQTGGQPHDVATKLLFCQAGACAAGPQHVLCSAGLAVHLQAQHAAVEVEGALQARAQQRHVVHAVEQDAPCTHHDGFM